MKQKVKFKIIDLGFRKKEIANKKGLLSYKKLVDLFLKWPMNYNRSLPKKSGFKP